MLGFLGLSSLDELFAVVPEALRLGRGLDLADGSPEPDFEAQVRRAFANLEATLLAGGCRFDDIVDVTTFHTNPEKQLGTARAVRDEFFKSAPYPSLTGLGVTWLAGFDFEIKVIARIPSRA